MSTQEYQHDTLHVDNGELTRGVHYLIPAARTPHRPPPGHLLEILNPHRDRVVWHLFHELHMLFLHHHHLRMILS
jgi:hypothetical protein